MNAIHRNAAYADARRTLAALAGSGLAILPLRQIFTDWTWLAPAWFAMALAVLPAAVLRLYWQPRVLQLLPGAVLVTMLLTHVYVPTHAVGGVLPLRGSWPDVSALLTQFGDTLREDAAPLRSTEAIRLVVTVQVVLLAIAVDLLAVIARRPALAGVPFLLVFTVAGAVPRHPVGWVLFGLSAAGFLLLLASDAHDELLRWGRVMPRVGGGRANPVGALSGRRIGVIAIAVAIAVPLVLPARSGNIVADALHRSSGSGGSGDGTGDGGGGIAIDPLAKLQGQLTLGKPKTLFSVRTTSPQGHQPYNLRQSVLDQFDGATWRQGDAGPVERLDRTSFGSVPPAPQPASIEYAATISITKLVGAPPILQSPSAILGLNRDAEWTARNQVVVNTRIGDGDSYTEQVSEPAPTPDELAATTAPVDPSLMQRWLQLPAWSAATTAALMRTLTPVIGTRTTPYAKARALSDFFLDPRNGFVYSLSTKLGDSTNDLLNFLSTRSGFCQQYAAAMAVLLRMAGVPSRVIIGFTHPAADGSGTFTVTTRDAHAWVEAFIPDFGWIPFDPTPLAQSPADVGRAPALPWGPVPSSTTPGQPSSSASGSSGAPTRNRQTLERPEAGLATSSAPGAARGNDWLAPTLLALLVTLALLASVPAITRARRRRARLRAAAAHPDALWAELAATAVDLGYVWSPVRTPRQVVGWLHGEGVSGEAAQSLATLAGVVERARYAPTVAVADGDLIEELRRVEGSLRTRRSLRTRLRARFAPQSVGWVRNLVRGGRH